jgi:hypothetical protein
MRRLFYPLAILALLWPQAGNAWSLINHTGAASPTFGSSCVTPGITTTGATLFVVAVNNNTGSGTQVMSDSNSNTWTAIASGGDTNGFTDTMWYSASPSVGTGHTFQFTGNGCTINVLAFSGSAVSPLDQSIFISDQNGSTTFNVGPLTPSVNNELVVSANGNGQGGNYSSIDSGFTAEDPQNQVVSTSYGGAIAYLIQTTAAAVNPTWTYTAATNFAGVAASFQAGVGVVPCSRSRRGVGC